MGSNLPTRGESTQPTATSSPLRTTKDEHTAPTTRTGLDSTSEEEEEEEEECSSCSKPQPILLVIVLSVLGTVLSATVVFLSMLYTAYKCSKQKRRNRREDRERPAGVDPQGYIIVNRGAHNRPNLAEDPQGYVDIDGVRPEHRVVAEQPWGHRQSRAEEDGRDMNGVVAEPREDQHGYVIVDEGREGEDAQGYMYMDGVERGVATPRPEDDPPPYGEVMSGERR